MSDAGPRNLTYGVVAIGRNEGERLMRCLESVAGAAECVVYVDSGSTDRSVPMARDKGVRVVELDMSTPFTAARARNEGFRLLRELAPTLAYVQFVDGDCEVADGWPEYAVQYLDERVDVAVVCGRRREKFSQQSVYNMLCDAEWDTPVGEAKACGGDAMMRVGAFEEVAGYRSDLIAGEEPELCLRLRAKGWRIWRLDKEMTLHDAAMTRFTQWWTRMTRGGYAYAEGAYLYGATPERYCVRETIRAWIWGAGLPIGVLVLVTLIGAWGLAPLALYPLQYIRLAYKGVRDTKENWHRAFFLVLGKLPEMVGQLKFYGRLLSGQKAQLIEYK